LDVKRSLQIPWAGVATVLLLVLLFLLFAPSPQAVHIEELTERARREVESGDTLAAYQTLQEALDLNPDQQTLYLSTAELALQTGQLDAAANLFEAVLQYEPDNHYARCLLGRVQFAQGQLDEARRNVSSGCSGFNTFLKELALAYAAAGQPDRALATAEEYFQHAPGDRDALEQAALHTAAVAPQDALPLLRAALQDPDLSNDLFPALIRAIEDARLQENPAMVYAAVGQVFVRFQCWPLARSALQMAVDADAEFSAAYAYLGFVLEQLQEDGYEALQRAYELEPDSLIAVLFLTDNLIQNQRALDALSLLENLLETQPANPAVYAQIGAASAASGDFPTAKSAYLQAVELAPGESTFWLALAQFSLHYEVEVAEVGLPAARNAVILSPEDASALDTLGYAHLLLGNTDIAARFLQQALAASPERAETWLHQGLLLQLQGDTHQAALALAEAAALDPAGSAGQRAARMLENLPQE